VRIAGLLRDPESAALPLLGSLKLMQELYGLGEAVHGYALYLRPGVDPLACAARLNALLPPTHRATGWMENHQELLSALRLEKSMMFFVLLSLLVIAAFSFSCALVFNVVKKTREIGLLQALGATPREIALCFCVQSSAIGLLGTLTGFAAGWGVLRFRDPILSAFQHGLSALHLPTVLRHCPHLPVRYDGHDLLLIFLFANAVCLLAGLLPAGKAAKIAPAQALRVEN